jgi:hypothetical protein
MQEGWRERFFVYLQKDAKLEMPVAFRLLKLSRLRRPQLIPEAHHAWRAACAIPEGAMPMQGKRSFSFRR